MSDIRQTVRRDESLTAMARLLFAEIYEMWEDEGQCFASNGWLADKIGASPSSVRRWKRQLREAEYIHEKHEGGQRYLTPKERAIRSDRGDQQQPDQGQSSSKAARSDRGAVNSDREGAIRSDQDRDINNSEGTQGSARARGDRWAFLPSYRRRHLPEIKQEAGPPDHNPDVLEIAERCLGPTDVDLPAVVDDHLHRRSEDEVIAAYVIARRTADKPLPYADTIIRDGWKEGSSDGAPVLIDEEPNVVRFSDR